ncbi:methyltransferase domain-containing protein [bacterium]|nr:methyltransferase domain-containing protein [bacterium]
MSLFLMIHSELPREGPGNRESTGRALSLIRDLPPKPRILDVGCGPGMQTLDLADLTDGTITALDYHQSYLDVLAEKVRGKGLEGRIRIVRGDMTSMDFAQGSFDLIWSEGAIYIMGFEQGLVRWRPFLSAGGHIAVSEATWLKPNPPAEVRKFWDEGYPEMRDTESNLKLIEARGYRPVGHFILPRAAWWQDYFNPLEKRLERLVHQHKNDRGLLRLIEQEKKEIELYRRYSHFYGYVFYVMRKSEENAASPGAAAEK